MSFEYSYGDFYHTSGKVEIELGTVVRSRVNFM